MLKENKATEKVQKRRTSKKAKTSSGQSALPRFVTLISHRISRWARGELATGSRTSAYFSALTHGHYHIARGVLAKFHRLHRAKSHPQRMVHTAASQFFAGALGGGCATYSTHWLDTVKVRMQTNPAAYTGALQCLANTVHQTGVRGLYQGALPAVTGNAVKASIVFMSYGICQECVRWALPRDHRGDRLTVVELAAAGAMTGVLASFALCPLELVKCRMQAADTPHAARRGPVRLAVRVAQREGVRGLYRGLTGMWTKEVPGSFIYFGSYEAARAGMAHSCGAQCAESKLGIFACGMMAGLAFCVTHPLESIKTRVQVETTSRHGFFRASYQIVKNDGVRPLYRGMLPSLVRAGLFSGIQFVIYELVRDTFIPKEERQ